MPRCTRLAPLVLTLLLGCEIGGDTDPTPFPSDGGSGGTGATGGKTGGSGFPGNGGNASGGSGPKGGNAGSGAAGSAGMDAAGASSGGSGVGGSGGGATGGGAGQAAGGAVAGGASGAGGQVASGAGGQAASGAAGAPQGGSGGSAGAGGAMSCGNVTWSPASCDACMKEQCCALGAECSAKSACNKIVLCASDCPNQEQACVDACKAMSPQGADLFQSYLDCHDTKCAGCSQGGGGSGGSGGGCGNVTWSPASCQTCMTANCCAEGATCSKNKNCIQLLNCSSPCGLDTACVDACKAMYPAGESDFSTYLGCFNSNCSACPGG